MTKIIKMDSKGRVAESKTISQSNLTADCWLIQFWGLKACDDCPLKDTSECGGQEIRANLIQSGEYGKIKRDGLPNES